MNKKVFIPVLVAIFLIGSAGFATKASAESFWAHLGLGLGIHQGDQQQQEQGDHNDQQGQNENENDQNQNDENNTQSGIGEHMRVRPMNPRGVYGTVTAISGTTITLENKGFGENPNTTTYTVDASNASIMKAGSTITVSNIAVGDMLVVQGTVNGTTVTAVKIMDGVGPRKDSKHPAPISLFSNGQPVIGGKITAISGNTVTITNNSNVAYTIDVASAKIYKDGATTAVSNLAVGDQLLAQGTINGTSVTAATVIDGSATNNASEEGRAHGNFFGQIGSFFKHIFGF